MSPLGQEDKTQQSKDLKQGGNEAYTPAYKQGPKTPQKVQNSLPPDLAEIVSVWPDLPEHIKAAIKALVQTFNSNKSK